MHSCCISILQDGSDLTTKSSSKFMVCVFFIYWFIFNAFIAEKNKAAGSLPPFDSSATYVHPRSRTRKIIVINPVRAFAKNPALKSVPRKKPKDIIVVDNDSEPEEVPDSEDDDEEEDKSEDGDYGAPSRRSTRATKKPVKNLPFSPQKRRAKKGVPVRDSGDEADGEDDGGNAADTNVAARRSSRTTKNAKASYKEDEYVDIEDDQEKESDEDDDKSRKTRNKMKGKAKKTKKIVRGKASRPAYGNFRAVADLDYDAFSDDETVTLRAHRDVCEKCHRGPGHMLVEAASKPKGKGRKKQDEDEDADLEGTEMERLIALGGWVRWYVGYFEIFAFLILIFHPSLKCPVAAHWGCLAR